MKHVAYTHSEMQGNVLGLICATFCGVKPVPCYFYQPYCSPKEYKNCSIIIDDVLGEDLFQHV